MKRIVLIIVSSILALSLIAIGVACLADGIPAGSDNRTDSEESLTETGGEELSTDTDGEETSTDGESGQNSDNSESGVELPRIDF